jgi:arylamine N-acetyltransferase
MLPNEHVCQYLHRIGIKQLEQPSIEYLFELHKAHVERISWQTIDIFYGKPRSIDIDTSIDLILNGRSGYCFHLNGAFSQLLHTLGFSVHLHRAGVQPHGAHPVVDSYHLGLTVEINNERWIVDVGLGDMPYEPLPLRQGIYPQGPFIYKVLKSSVTISGWRMENDPLGGFSGVDLELGERVEVKEFIPKHLELSTSPNSPWVNLLLVRNRTADGANVLKGCIYTRRDHSGIRKFLLDKQAEWFEALSDIFGEHLANYSIRNRDELWSKVLRKHEEWQSQNHT